MREFHIKETNIMDNKVEVSMKHRLEIRVIFDDALAVSAIFLPASMI